MTRQGAAEAAGEGEGWRQRAVEAKENFVMHIRHNRIPFWFV